MLGARRHDYKEAQGVSWDDRNVLGGDEGGYVGLHVSQTAWYPTHKIGSFIYIKLYMNRNYF